MKTNRIKDTVVPQGNYFKLNIVPTAPKPDVHISEKEMALYNYVRLKIAYQQNEVEGMVNAIRHKQELKAIRFNNIATRSICGAMALAIIGIIVKHVLL